MTVKELLDRIAQTKGSRALEEKLRAAGSVRVDGASGSLVSLLVAGQAQAQVVVVVDQDRDAASYRYNDLYQILEASGADPDRVMLLPTAYRRAISSDREDPSGLVQRTTALTALSELQKGDAPLFLCTWPEAMAEKVAAPEQLSSSKIMVHRSEKISMDFLQQTVDELGFEHVEFVALPGQYALRGGIFDIFSYASNRPYRLDFLGNEVDSIRSFSPATQLTDESVERIALVPNLKQGSAGEHRVALGEYTATLSVVAWYTEAEQSFAALDLLKEGAGDKVSSRKEWVASTKNWKSVFLGAEAAERRAEATVTFESEAQPVFHKNFELLTAHIASNYERGLVTYLVTGSDEQFERLQGVVDGVLGGEVPLERVPLTLHQGFSMPELNGAFYTDHQIFERYLRYRVRGEIDKAEGMTIAELSALKVGDYVVHIDHGVGRFGGLVKQRQGEQVREFIKLSYRDGDVLFVGVHNLHRISKFKDGDGTVTPVLHKLGTSQWARQKETTKRKVKEMARELTELYARRKASQGFAYSPDSYMQQELEASFLYEDTPDQHASTEAVKRDMEAPTPMDRLVCGDVGFGKTEIAIRAAFKAATDNKQVAILVPTTLLSLQHYRTFTRRLKRFPVKIANFSRAKGTKETAEILKQIEAGTVDIVIGTHKLLGKNVQFKDLGLLIVDEEQKFGVGMKERLRELKVSVDTLTLTATPIPRTLQFSLLGARDLSIINTPPPNRRPVATEVHVWDDEVVRAAIEYELSRGGQVYVLHNRVQTIDRFAAQIERLVPGARVAVGHGQMNPKELEQTIMDFVYGECNVLVATSIIESGIDIPNANTIVINNAHLFGLSDLHQLRGRVGRTNRKAFCYLMIPSNDALTSEASRRLRAIEEFSDLGSGFHIAMQDLDIRGAGNILGAEQSGFMADIGYETFQRIVAEAMDELQEEQGGELPQKAKGSINPVDCVVEIEEPAYFPDNYIGSTSEKIRLYRELDGVGDAEALARFATRLVDRFGEPPAEAKELFEVVLLRAVASRLGFERVSIKGSRGALYFAYAPQSLYYAGPVFGAIMSAVLGTPREWQMKQGAKLSVEAKNIKSLADLRTRLEHILPKTAFNS